MFLTKMIQWIIIYVYIYMYVFLSVYLNQIWTSKFQLKANTKRRMKPIKVNLIPPHNKDSAAFLGFWFWFWFCISGTTTEAESSPREEQAQVT